jgi:hypothetical protein
MNMALIASEPQGKKSALRFEIDSDTRHMLKLYSDFAPWLEQHKHQQAGNSSPVAAGPKTAHTTTKHEAQK